MNHSVHYQNIKGNLSTNIPRKNKKVQVKASKARVEKANPEDTEIKAEYDPTVLAEINTIWKQKLT